ncbi:hypothetical protein [Metabacillus sp. RGM 3146]|uniref:hypothetical protein n=1 Tax=Metabacillus sp. RGM 3146 TaxID=3401092 RepID=UPI003B9CEC0D
MKTFSFPRGLIVKEKIKPANINKSKEFYLTFSQTGAIDKKDMALIIDPLMKKVLKKPGDNPDPRC